MRIAPDAGIVDRCLVFPFRRRPFPVAAPARPGNVDGSRSLSPFGLHRLYQFDARAAGRLQHTRGISAEPTFTHNPRQPRLTETPGDPTRLHCPGACAVRQTTKRPQAERRRGGEPQH
jgi:hypothetical protein